jgi:hypothetical protein
MIAELGPRNHVDMGRVLGARLARNFAPFAGHADASLHYTPDGISSDSDDNSNDHAADAAKA